MFIPALMNLEERRKLAFKAKTKEGAAAATSVFFNEPRSNTKNLILWLGYYELDETGFSGKVISIMKIAHRLHSLRKLCIFDGDTSA